MSFEHQASSKSEISGAFLLAILQSFDKLHILPPELIPFSATQLLPDAWYPYDHLIKLNLLIEEHIPQSESILFWAGIKFINIWYWQGPGKDMIHSGMDWVYCNDKGGGYNSVVRGEDIGWCHNLSTDEAKGVALVENVMPISPAYLRGIFFGGFYLFDDMAYYNTEIESISDNTEYPFRRTVIKLIFKQSNKSVAKSRLEQLNNPCHHALPLTTEEAEEIFWRYRHQLNLFKLQRDYNTCIDDLMAQAFDKLHLFKNELATANQRLAVEATTDALTGLNNKRYFNQEIGRTLNAAKREHHSVCVMMIDIDYFKRFNDHYGHLAGDAAIKQVAQCIKSNVARGTDLVVRFGGEEFVLVLVNIDTAGIRTLAKKIAAELDARQIPHEQSNISPHLTVSLGSTLSKGANNIEELLKMADDALYLAKAQGRNRHIHLD